MSRYDNWHCQSMEMSFLADCTCLTFRLFRNAGNCTPGAIILFILSSSFHLFHPRQWTERIFLEIKNASRSSSIWAIGLSFPFTSSFILPRAINPFLLLTLTRERTLLTPLRLIYFRSCSRGVFPFTSLWCAATLDRSVRFHLRGNILYLSRVHASSSWWTAFKCIAPISRARAVQRSIAPRYLRWSNNSSRWTCWTKGSAPLGYFFEH